MTVIAMSRTEIDRMHVLRDLAAGRMTANEAAQLTRLTRRHMFRLAKAYRERGPSARSKAHADFPAWAPSAMVMMSVVFCPGKGSLWVSGSRRRQASATRVVS